MSQFPCWWCRKFVKRGGAVDGVQAGLCVSCAFTANGGFESYGSRAVQHERRRRYGPVLKLAKPIIVPVRQPITRSP